jgi:DNA-binding MarR family transcriptional regulator
MSTGSYPGLTEPRIGALLRLASEATHRILLQRLHAAGFDDVRASHFELFKFPGPEGMHPTELADHVGLSKQALNHLLNELESLGYLTRQTTGTDGRHRVVRLTDRGLVFAAAVKAAVLAIEDELTIILGERRMTRLKADLTAIPAGLKAAEGTIDNLVSTTCGEVQQQNAATTPHQTDPVRPP